MDLTYGQTADQDNAATDLLATRERQALRWTASVRIASMLISAVVISYIALRTSELAALLSLLGAGLAIQMLILVLLQGKPLFTKQQPTTVSRRTGLGLLGTGTDIVIMCALPLVWHLVYTTDGEPLAHLSAHNFTAVSLAFVAMNGLALRPLYPALMTTAAVLVHLGLAWLAIDDPRLQYFRGGLEAALGVGTSTMDMIFTTPFFIALAGGLVTLACHSARSAVREAVQREYAENQLRQNQLQAVLEAKMAAVGDLVAGVQHEVNNPLGALHSAADTAGKAQIRLLQALKEDGAERSAQRAAQALERSLATVDQASRRLSDVMATIRGFVQLDRAEMQRLELAQAVRTVMDMRRSTWRDDTEVAVDLEDGVAVQADPRRLAQALDTVLRNAAESLDGPGQVSVELRCQEGLALLLIQDSGRGMDAKQLAGLFDIDFAHGERTRARFGLPLCRSILHRHGGDISLESIEGKGTTVTLTLPLVNRDGQS
jgi:signal transduction histidine kinase